MRYRCCLPECDRRPGRSNQLRVSEQANATYVNIRAQDSSRQSPVRQGEHAWIPQLAALQSSPEEEGDLAGPTPTSWLSEACVS
jgi:hypothetical protein